MFEQRLRAALFKLEHMLKDVRHMPGGGAARSASSCSLPSLAESLYAGADEAGHGEEDFAAIYTAFD